MLLRADSTRLLLARVLLLVTATAVTIACSGTIGVSAVGQARAKWERLEPRRYSFVLELKCFCTPEMSGPFAVTVRDGMEVVTREGQTVSPEWLTNVPTTAEELFTFVEERQNQKDFRAEFDQATGLPTKVWSDPIPEAVDDELGIIVSRIVIEEAP